MINFSAPMGMNYGYEYGIRGEESRNRIRGLGQNEEDKNKVKGLGQDKDDENKVKGLGQNKDDENKVKGLRQDKDDENKVKGLRQDKDEKHKIKGIGQDEADPNKECQTCKKRKYKDGSDEMVSFKSPTHISPESAASAVRAHEQEHVSNAFTKAAKGNGKVIAASVSIHTAICPECGRTYVSGGTTHTQIKYFNEDNPYQKSLKSADRTKYSGMNLDYAV